MLQAFKPVPICPQLWVSHMKPGHWPLQPGKDLCPSFHKQWRDPTWGLNPLVIQAQACCWWPDLATQPWLWAQASMSVLCHHPPVLLVPLPCHGQRSSAPFLGNPVLASPRHANVSQRLAALLSIWTFRTNYMTMTKRVDFMNTIHKEKVYIVHSYTIIACCWLSCT